MTNIADLAPHNAKNNTQPHPIPCICVTMYRTEVTDYLMTRGKSMMLKPIKQIKKYGENSKIYQLKNKKMFIVNLPLYFKAYIFKQRRKTLTNCC